MKITAFSLPNLRISPKGLTFNAACMQLMPNVTWVQFRYSFKEGKLFAVESSAYEPDSVPWRLNCSSHEVYAKRVKWDRFYYFICDGMQWLAGNHYTIPATLRKADDGKQYIFFDLTNVKESSPVWNLKVSDFAAASIAD